jgi:hypothetical protein
MDPEKKLRETRREAMEAAKAQIRAKGSTNGTDITPEVREREGSLSVFGGRTTATKSEVREVTPL